MKVIIREGLAMIILVAAILLIIVIAFFDYIKDQSNIPIAAKYNKSAEVTEILQSKGEFENETNSITLSSSALTVDYADLQQYKNSEDLKMGQSTPFDELAITRIQYDDYGNAYYKVSSDTKVKGFNYDSVAGDTTNSTTGNPSQSTDTTSNTTTSSQDQPLYTKPDSGK